MKPLLFKKVILMVISTFSITVSANAVLKKNKSIQFYVDDIKPWAYTENGIKKGVLVDWAQAIIDKSGVETEVVFAPLPRVTKYLMSNEADVALHIYDESLSSSVDIIGSLTPLKTAIISRKDTNITSLDDLSDLVICQTRGIDYSNILTNNITLTFNNYQVGSYEQLNKMLFLDRCDAVISIVDSFFYIAAKLGHSKDEFAKPFIIETRYGGLLVSKNTKNRSAKQKIQAAYLKLEAQGKLKAIINKHIGTNLLKK